MYINIVFFCYQLWEEPNRLLPFEEVGDQQYADLDVQQPNVGIGHEVMLMEMGIPFHWQLKTSVNEAISKLKSLHRWMMRYVGNFLPAGQEPASVEE